MNLLPANTGAVKITALLVMLCLMAGKDSIASTPPSDTIQIQKATVRKSYRLNLYPDANQKVVFFSVRGGEGQVYQIYVFDIEGKLVKQAETRNKETVVLKGIDKGVYQFEVMSDDLRIGNGQIAVR